MNTLVEVRIGSGMSKPKLIKLAGGDWVVQGLVTQHVGHGRAVWVKTYIPDARGVDSFAKDGKGFLVGPTRKLTLG